MDPGSHHRRNHGRARREARISNVTQDELTISYERASGEAKTAKLGKAASAANDTTVTVAIAPRPRSRFSDGTGKAVAKGTVADNGAYLLMPKGSGYTLEHVGSLASKSDVYPGVVIVNALPESYKVDLYGHFGKIGLKGRERSRRASTPARRSAFRPETTASRPRSTSRTARPSTASASSRSAGFT